MAPFASDATHVSSSGTTLAKTGIQNAFANAAQLANISTGAALTTTPGGNGAVPQSEINTLANILAACVNSTGPGSTACNTLLADAKSSGTTGTAPTDTATAAINIAHNPGVNIAALFALSTGTPPFSPGLTVAPNDFLIAVNFSGGGIGTNGPNSIAIDANANVWVATINSNTISEFASNGVAISPSTGFTGGGLGGPNGIAIDLSGNVWLSNGGSGISKFSSTGSAISPDPFGYLVAGVNGGGPAAIALDVSGNAWVADDLQLSPHVSRAFELGFGLISPSTGWTGAGVIDADAVAIDASGNVWFADGYVSPALSKFSGSGGTSLL